MIFEYFTLIRCRQPYEIVHDPRLPLSAGRGFPQEMLEDIISRLHPKELCTFKTVSKGFEKLIASKSFQMNNLRKMEALDRSVYIFKKEYAYAPLFYHVSGLHRTDNGRITSLDTRDLELLTSSDGLVLFCDNLDDCYLFNPVTHQTRVLPTCKLAYPDGCTSAQVFFGMGYILEEDDYKIVRISTFNSLSFITEVMVYSKNLGNWLRAPNLQSTTLISQCGVQVCGRVHWGTSNEDNIRLITTFDLHHEIYTSFKMPEIDPSYPIQQIVSLDSTTLAISCSLLAEGSIHTLWILKDYCDDTSWYKVNINLAAIGNHFGLMTVRPLAFVHTTKKGLLICVEPSGVFGIFNIEKKTFIRVGNEEVGAGFTAAYRFIPSLHSPHPIV